MFEWITTVENKCNAAEQKTVGQIKSNREGERVSERVSVKNKKKYKYKKWAPTSCWWLLKMKSFKYIRIAYAEVSKVMPCGYYKWCSTKYYYSYAEREEKMLRINSFNWFNWRKTSQDKKKIEKFHGQTSIWHSNCEHSLSILFIDAIEIFQNIEKKKKIE